MRKKEIPLLYGQRKDGHICHVDDVPNGKACGCVCPSCGEPLEAKQGTIKIHHFAHIGGSECAYVRQTNIHCMAEEILEESKTLVFPKSEEVCFKNQTALFFPFQQCHVDEVMLEKRVSDFIPDIIIKSRRMTILVEIFVTHPVDEPKKDKIRKSDADLAIEIDLSDLAYKDISKEDLKHFIEDSSRSHWLLNRIEDTAKTNYEHNRDIIPIHQGRVCCPQMGSKLSATNCDKCLYQIENHDDSVSCNFRLVQSLRNDIRYPRIRSTSDKVICDMRKYQCYLQINGKRSRRL